MEEPLWAGAERAHRPLDRGQSGRHRPAVRDGTRRMKTAVDDDCDDVHQRKWENGRRDTRNGKRNKNHERPTCQTGGGWLGLYIPTRHNTSRNHRRGLGWKDGARTSFVLLFFVAFFCFFLREEDCLVRRAVRNVHQKKQTNNQTKQGKE